MSKSFLSTAALSAWRFSFLYIRSPFTRTASRRDTVYTWLKRCGAVGERGTRVRCSTFSEGIYAIRMASGRPPSSFSLFLFCLDLFLFALACSFSEQAVLHSAALSAWRFFFLCIIGGCHPPLCLQHTTTNQPLGNHYIYKILGKPNDYPITPQGLPKDKTRFLYF